MNETDALTKAVAAWVTAVLPHLGQEQRQIFDGMLAGHYDVAVEARLRKGTITLRAIDEALDQFTVLHSDEAQGRFAILYSDEVGPLRTWNQ